MSGGPQRGMTTSAIGTVGAADRSSAPAPSRHRLCAVVLVVGVGATLAAAAGIWVNAVPGEQVYGDEPHYLITALSLGQDFTLDVRAAFAQQLFDAFYQHNLFPQAAPRPDGRVLEPHSPLLPALLAVPMVIGGWVAAKLVMTWLAGLLAGLMVWTAVRRFDTPVLTSAVTIGALAISAPMIVYGNQIYPELPAALAVTIAVAAVTTDPIRLHHAVALFLAVVALPWLAPKYIPVAATLTAIALLRIWRARQRRMMFGLTACWTVMAVVFAAAHYHWYGGLTPYKSSRLLQRQLHVMGADFDLLERASRLVGLLIDRGYGIAAWQPAWLLLVPATVALLRWRPPHWQALLGPLAIGWLTASFAAVTMHGLWFPARHVIVVLPLAAIVVTYWVGNDLRRLALIATAGALGMIGYAFLVIEGTWGGVTWITHVDTRIYPWLTSDLSWLLNFDTTNYPWYRLWRTALPDYAHITTGTWALTATWLAVLAMLALWGGQRARLRQRSVQSRHRADCP